jgi:hypothetical protein
MNLQQHQRPTLLALVVFALLGAAGLLKLPSVVASSRSATAADVTQTRIARAMSAGPADIARSAESLITNAMERLSFCARAATASPACPAIRM